MLYTDTLRARMVRRMIGPRATSANALAKETGISQSTLSKWLRQTGSFGRAMKDDDTEQAPDRRPQDWSAEEKLRAVVETAGLDDERLGQYLRRHGLHGEQLSQWRAAATAGLAEPSAPAARRGANADSKRIKELERELRKKDAALAEYPMREPRPGQDGEVTAEWPRDRRRSPLNAPPPAPGQAA